VIAFLKSSSLLFFSSLLLALILSGESKPERSIVALLNKRFQEQEKKASLAIKENPQLVRGWSGRGDMRLFLGDFKGAKSDFEKMIQLDPSLEVSHWRLGIAYFYLKEYDKAARQFEIYHNYDAIDRENGIWRFMSQFKSKGLRTAREGLLIYKKDDRPPYPLLYEMFAGRLKPDEVFTEIEKVNYPENYRNRVLFHATLYVGIYLELVEGNKEMAGNLLRKAFENKYGRATGTYMWQVARLHYFQLLARSEPGTQKPFAGRK
jgi:lipoprotein NlpI